MLSLANACTIVDRALEVGRLNKLQPLTVVVLDAGGEWSRSGARMAEHAREGGRAQVGCAEASGPATC